MVNFHLNLQWKDTIANNKCVLSLLPVGRHNLLLTRTKIVQKNFR